ncbi:MAG: M20/M25/M40 family metallo-hydrolase [Baekduia sp.]
MTIPAVLEQLLTTTGPSGYETAPAKAMAEACRAFTADVTTDAMGSVIARVPGTAGGPAIAFVGHIDEIGLIVTHIDDNGFLRFVGVGGWDPMILVGQRVELTTKDGVVAGVVGKKAIHLMSPDDRKKAPELKDLHIDIGAGDGDEARSLVRVGDVAVIAGRPQELRGGRVASRSMDNRLGCYVAYEAARLVAEAGGAPGDVLAVGVVQEEITMGGARAFAHGPELSGAVVIDVTHETGAPGVEVNELGKHEFGSGPVIERGSILHPRMFELLAQTAEREEIAHTLAASAGRTGTDADAIHLARTGVPTGLIGLPLRYMHSPVELVQLSDVEDAAKLLAAFALALDPDEGFARS